MGGTQSSSSRTWSRTLTKGAITAPRLRERVRHTLRRRLDPALSRFAAERDVRPRRLRRRRSRRRSNPVRSARRARRALAIRAVSAPLSRKMLRDGRLPREAKLYRVPAARRLRPRVRGEWRETASAALAGKLAGRPDRRAVGWRGRASSTGSSGADQQSRAPARRLRVSGHTRCSQADKLSRRVMLTRPSCAWSLREHIPLRDVPRTLTENPSNGTDHALGSARLVSLARPESRCCALNPPRRSRPFSAVRTTIS